MIFKIHYFVFNAGLSGVLVFLTVFLRKYSDASSSQVGTLLMILPFVAVITKPLCCALADQHQRHKSYLIVSLAFTLIGFGSYLFLPIFPHLFQGHSQLTWWLLVLCTIIGYLAYGVAWSLGDACAANVAHKTGESFGNIRLWGTVGWGVAGALVGMLSPSLEWPDLVPGFALFVLTFVFEIILLLFWQRKSDFQMTNENELDNSSSSIDGIVVISNGKEKRISLPEENIVQKENEANTSWKLQWVVFKMVAKANKSLFKYLILFVILGAIYNIHWSFFFLHLDAIALQSSLEAAKRLMDKANKTMQLSSNGTLIEEQQSEVHDNDFSKLVSLCLVAQAIGETCCFLIAPFVVRKLGRDGAISLNAIAYAVRYLGNGIGIPLVSPYVALATESLQGINYGIFYYLITDTALAYALKVDQVLDDVKSASASATLTKGSHKSKSDQIIINTINMLNDKQMQALRCSLRATMQGLFSAAFDGLGFGLGALIAGSMLEYCSYEQLWTSTGIVAAFVFVLHAIYELYQRKLASYKSELKEQQLHKQIITKQQIHSQVDKFKRDFKSIKAPKSNGNSYSSSKELIAAA